MKKVIHVNRHEIAANKKNGTRRPVLAVKTYKGSRYAREVVVRGPCRVVYRPDRPLSCGATVWIETDGEVEVVQ